VFSKNDFQSAFDRSDLRPCTAKYFFTGQDRMSASRGRIIPADRPVVAVPGADAGTASPVQAAPATAASAADKTWFGVAVQPVTGKDMRIMHMEYGRWPVVFVSEVAKDSPAGKIGIRLNDIILSSLSVCSAEQPNPEIWEPLQYNSFYNKKLITKSPGILLVWTYRFITEDARANRIEDV
jgi:hypothetical protein